MSLHPVDTVVFMGSLTVVLVAAGVVLPIVLTIVIVIDFDIGLAMTCA